MTLTIQIVRSIHELNQIEWGEFSAGSAFQSHLWYAFGEKVMGERMAARAALWRIYDEPLRLGSGAYEFKRRLGFVLEDNNRIGVMGAGALSRWLTGPAAPGS